MTRIRPVPAPGRSALQRAALRVVGLAAAALATATVAAPPALRLDLPRSSLRADELGIVVRAGDPVSEAIAQHYRAARGIPAENIVRLPLPPAGESVPAAEFAALKAQLDRELPARVQATVLTWVHPSRVTGTCAMSITAAFALGYDERRCSVGDKAGRLASPYFDSDTTRPWDELHLRPSMMLGAETLAEARELIDRGVRADHTRPPGDGYLVRTTDGVRSIRWPDFQAAADVQRARGGVRLNLVDNLHGPAGNDGLSDRSGVMFYFTGLARTPGLSSNTYRPGAVGDSLTSSGGVLDGTRQTTVAEWLHAGLTASYGTVEEPFAHTSKFPQVSVLLDHYTRGATLIEAYWKSVLHPGQGLFVGEPLARPFADRPQWQRPQALRADLATRALRPGRRYPVWHREDDRAPWTAVGLITGQAAPDPRYRISLPAAVAASGELRVAPEPCPEAPRIASAVRGDAAPLAAGRARRLVYQVVLARASLPPGCEADPGGAPPPADPDRFDVVTGPLAPGVSMPASTPVALKPGSTAVARVEVDLSADVAQPVVVPFALRGSGAGVAEPLGSVRIAVAPTATPLRLVEPGPGWDVASATTGTRRLPVVADVDPASGITRVRVSLRGALSAAPGPAAEGVAVAPGFAAELALPPLPPGAYRLTARGEDRDGVERATASVLVQVSVPLR